MAVQEYKPIYSAKEVSKILQISINTVYQLMNSGSLPYLVLGSKKIRGSDLERFIEKYPAAGAGIDENTR
ncbi:helix-turn-helix domain-containing protein [Catenibacillus scindens]|uniref:helix-turn-helix domain-containing protein n=1 Tax=Catenibacillus scindens TaxID=673271 RepID=UPI00320AD227